MASFADLKTTTAGILVPAYDGAQAFVPHRLPRRIELDSDLVYRLDRASRAVAGLSGVGETLPNPHLLIRPFLRREAVLSSMIEGTQTSISELFLYEASGPKKAQGRFGDAREVANYVTALEYGLERLQHLPLSVRLFNEIHAQLMHGVRGRERYPGELRKEQVWIGSEGTSIGDARFVPPPADRVRDLLSDLELFLNEDLRMPPLVQCALMHYQFEAIHPYSDGNGRMGRLLIILFLCAKNVLPKPLLYLSVFLEQHRQQYYDLLLHVSITGDWTQWLSFLLDGFEEQAQDAVERSRKVRDLLENYRLLLKNAKASGNAHALVDEFFERPFMTTTMVRDRLGVTYAGAKGVLTRLSDLGIIRPAGVQGTTMYVAHDLLRVIEAPTLQRSD